MRRHRSPLRACALSLTLSVGLLTPMAANMVGAQAGASHMLRFADTPSRSRSWPAARPRGFELPATGIRPDPVQIVRTAERFGRWVNVLVHVPHTLPATTLVRVQTLRRIGVVPAGSKYYGILTVAWVETVSPVAGGSWSSPTRGPGARAGSDSWWPKRDETRVQVHVDLSQHLGHGLEVRQGAVPSSRRDRRVQHPRRRSASTSSPTACPSPAVRTGPFAFGIPGIQPRLPAGWTGGNQLAIHGTNNPSSIRTKRERRLCPCVRGHAGPSQSHCCGTAPRSSSTPSA